MSGPVTWHTPPAEAGKVPCPECGGALGIVRDTETVCVRRFDYVTGEDDARDEAQTVYLAICSQDGCRFSEHAMLVDDTPEAAAQLAREEEDVAAMMAGDYDLVVLDDFGDFDEVAHG